MIRTIRMLRFALGITLLVSAASPVGAQQKPKGQQAGSAAGAPAAQAKAPSPEMRAGMTSRALPPLIPLEQFFDNPQVAGAQISPDGKWLSYLKPWRGKLNIWMRPVGGDAKAAPGAGGDRLMTMDTARPVTGYFWGRDSKRLLYVQDKGGNENYHVYAVPVVAGDTATPAARDLTPYANVRTLIMDVPRALPDRIFIGMNKRDPAAFDGYWLNLETGDTTLAVKNPGRWAGMLLDRENKPRVAAGQGASGGTEVFALNDATGEWKKVASYPAEENVDPLQVANDGKHLYLSSNHGSDLARLVSLDLATGAETVVDADPKGEVDLGAADFNDRTRELEATVYIADTIRVYPKNAELARDLARLRRVHEGSISVTSLTSDERLAIVAFSSPTDPSATYLYDRETGKATFLFRSRPWLKPAELAFMKPVSFKARDGLTVHGYLSTPRGVAAKNLPMVLLVHGGPWARDVYGYQPEAQLLANRGYAVLQVNYRGSTGYGKTFYNAAVKQFGRAMEDDLVDGVKWAIGQGIADPKKVAIYGGSYGGYATLVGVTRDSRLYACAVDYVGPSSLITLIQSFPAYWRPFLEGTWFRFVGDPAKAADVEDMKTRSPLFMVDSIRAPLLIVAGANDPRVTKREADQLAIALRDRGVPVHYIVAENEGHGFANADNRLALYRSMETFFGQCLGGRVQPQVSPAVDARIKQMTVDVSKLSLAPVTPAASFVDIKVGDAAVDGSRVPLAADTFKVSVSQAGQEQPFGTLVADVAAVQQGTTPALRLTTSLQGGPMAVFDTVVVAKATLAPLALRGHSPQGATSLDYAGAKVTGSSTPPGGTAQPIDVTLNPPAFDASAVMLVAVGLPLATGYAAHIPIYMKETGQQQAELRVTGEDNVDTPAGKAKAWIVEITMASPMGKTVSRGWVLQGDRRIVRQEIEVAPGVKLITSK